ncbi:MAG: YdiY family protein [Pseudomonadales bacterium]
MRLTTGTGRTLLLAVLLSAAAATQAGVLNLTNGDRLTGEIDSITGGRLILNTEFAGTIGVKLETVKNFESDKTFEIRMEDGTKSRGQFVVTSDAQQFRAEDGALADLNLATLKAAGENNLGITDLGSDWETRFDAGITASTGNSDTSAQNYLLESILTRSRSDHTLNFTYNTQEDDNVKTKDNLQAGYRYRRFFGERWYGLGNVGYQEDEFKGIDYRWTLGAGAGYQFWDNSQGALSTDLAANYVIEELEGVKDENPALRWGVDWNRFLWTKKAEAFYKQSVLFIFSDPENTVYNGSLGIRFNVTEMFTANLRVDVAHETEPADDLKKTDVTYVIGVGLVL